MNRNLRNHLNSSNKIKSRRRKAAEFRIVSCWLGYILGYFSQMFFTRNVAVMLCTLEINVFKTMLYCGQS